MLARLSTRLNLPEFGPWQVELEWEDPGNRLRERRKSQVDAVATGPCATILFECKFGEIDGGACSRTIPRQVGAQAGVRQCNGNYEMQTNPVNEEKARCALTGKGIRYWELIPGVFQLDSTADYIPCPFDGPSYQWMRNLVLAEEIRRSEARQTSFVIVYADHPNLPFPNKLVSPEWAEFIHALRTDTVQLHTISYQELLRIAVDAVGGSNTKWRDLEKWVLDKINRIGSTPKR